MTRYLEGSTMSKHKSSPTTKSSSLAQQEADFTSEGAPPPVKVPTSGRAAPDNGNARTRPLRGAVR
jgi:hypothetical protein